METPSGSVTSTSPPPPPAQGGSGNTADLMLVAAVATVVALLAILITLRIVVLRRQGRRVWPPARLMFVPYNVAYAGQEANSGLSQEVIDSIPTFNYTKDHPNLASIPQASAEDSALATANSGAAESSMPDLEASKPALETDSNLPLQSSPKVAGSEPLSCAICLEEYREGDVLKQLPKCCHVYHSQCLVEWFGRHNTCPICRMSVEGPNGDEKQPSSLVEHSINIDGA